MKRTLIIFLIIAVLIGTFFMSAKPVILAIARQQIKKAFQASDVTIRDCKLKPFNQISFFNIDVTGKLPSHLALKELVIDFSLFRKQASLYGSKIQYDKLKIEEIKSKVALQGEFILFDDLTCKLLGGTCNGAVSLRLTKPTAYDGSLSFRDLDMERLVNDFDLSEKFVMDGRLEGNVAFSVTGAGIRILSGDFSTAAPGGVLVIKDTGFLENLAGSSGQSLDILVESFKNYHYNTGLMSLSGRGRDIVLNVALEGETGKRNLNIALHLTD